MAGGGYIYRGTDFDNAPRVTVAMTPAAKDRLCADVLRILIGLNASLVASAERRFRATERSCCGTCGALYVGGSCDVCRARLEAAA